MIIYSIIQKSQLEGALRLDAEYYQPEYLEVSNKISLLSHISLKNYTEKIFSGPFGSTLKSESYQDTGIPFIRIGDISDIFIDKKNLVYISKEEHQRIYSTHLNPGDIVLSKIGTVGRLSVISDEFEEVNISENNIGIRLSKLPKEEKTALLFFLLSRYGQQQIIRKASGNIQLKLNVADVESVQVPIFDKTILKGLNDIYNDLLSRNAESQSLYSQAENLLLEELGLKDFESEGELWNRVKLSEVQKANRIDAEYFQDKYKKLISSFKNCDVKKLSEITERKKVIVKINPKSEYKYIEISNINVGNGEILFNVIQGNELPANAKMKITGGELIISKVRPTRGAIAIIPEGWNDNFIASGAFSVFEIKSPLKEYLQVVLRSIIGKLQLEKPTTGTSYPTVTDEDVENLIIPILPEAIQQKIADLVQKSHEARKKAKELLESAKQKVENLIEK